MARLTTLARLLLGLAFVVSAATYVVPLRPPRAPSAEALRFLDAFAATGLLAVVKIVELAAGLALLANRAVPLALALLAPLLVGILGFNVALAPASTALPAALLALELFLAWRYRGAFAPMLRLQVEPDPPPAPTDVRHAPAGAPGLRADARPGHRRRR